MKNGIIKSTSRKCMGCGEEGCVWVCRGACARRRVWCCSEVRAVGAGLWGCDGSRPVVLAVSGVWVWVWVCHARLSTLVSYSCARLPVYDTACVCVCVCVCFVCMQVSGLGRRQVVAVAAAKHHMLAATSAGELWSWGGNRDGKVREGSGGRGVCVCV